VLLQTSKFLRSLGSTIGSLLHTFIQPRREFFDHLSNFMLFSLSYLLPAFAVVISVSAVSLTDCSGAAYFITNYPSGNQVLAMNIASNGTLSGITPTSTGGLGASCNCTPALFNPLVSQGSIRTNAAKKILVTVNAGSNTLSMFKIDLENPAKLTMVGSPVSSGGEFPNSIAINDQGTMACVLNAGRVNGVNCYKPHLERGLIAIPNTLRSLGLILMTPPELSGSPSQVAFSEDGQTLVAAVKGFPTTTPGFLAAWAISSDGSLSAEPIKSPAPLGTLAFPFSTTLIPGTNAILVADTGVGFDIFNFGAEHSLSATSSAFPIPGQEATCWSSYSSKSGNFYFTDPGTTLVTEVNVDKNLQGTIVRQYQQAAGSGTVDNTIASVGPSNFLYILATGASTVDVLDVSTAGNAMTVQNFNFTSAAEKAGVTLNTTFNYLVGMTTFVY